MVASHVPPTVDLAQNSGMCPDWDSNQQPFGLQAGTQSTEPHQPGLWYFFFPGKLIKLKTNLIIHFILKMRECSIHAVGHLQPLAERRDRSKSLPAMYECVVLV